MRNDIAQALLLNVLEGTSYEEVEEARKYFQNMARYKYDDYQQFSTGMRFIERLALWLNQFSDNDKMTALNFIREKLVFISSAEMNLLVSSAFPDVLKGFLVRDVARELQIPDYKLASITNSLAYKKLIRQSLFCGMSDGAKIEVFRRSNIGIISHEQIYLTYELSSERAGKMQEELTKELQKIADPNLLTEEEKKFKRVFLLDDFSASGTSYLKVSTEQDKRQVKGKIATFYKSVFENNDFEQVFNLKQLKVYVTIYLCTEQAKNQIESSFTHLEEKYGNKPELVCLHIIPNSDKLNEVADEKIIQLCKEDRYYDALELEDEHTRKGGKDVKLGFGRCALPLVLSHNTPNNSVPLLWSYGTSSKFVGLFPRIPRHKEL
jgi:hypothetical protein